MTNTAVIAGAGIAGLSTAIALAQAGWAVNVLERGRPDAQLGAGLQVSANGFKVLDSLGVATALTETMFEPTHLQLRLGRSGRQIFALPIKSVSRARWGAPYVHIRRKDLWDALLSRTTDFPLISVNFDQKVLGFRNHENHVTASTDSGVEVTGDLLVGADGLHSKIRQQMHGSDQPRFTGNVAWRCMVPESELGELTPPATACVWAGAQRHAVTTRVCSGKMVNFVGIVEQNNWIDEGWTSTGTRQQALADFQGWHPTIQRILERSEIHHKWALCDRAPLPFWSDNRAVLVGDAAHPMLPSMAQGAVQALEDALALSISLSNGESIQQGLDHFFRSRAKRTSDIQIQSAKNLRQFHRSNWMTQFATYLPMYAAGKIAPRFVLRKFDWIYGHQVQ